MKTKLTIILALIANMMSAQVLTRRNEILDTLCQSKLTAVYLYTIHTSDADGKPVTDSLQLALQVGEEVWKTWACERYEYEKSGKDAPTYLPFMRNEILMHVATTTVGYPEGKITSIESISPHQYEVTEDMEKPVWKKAKGKNTVCGYQCRKATGEFRGKKWNVCYATDIPTTAGPWKLHGLPGLITYATDEKGIHTFQLISVNEESVPITRSSGYPFHNIIIDRKTMTADFTAQGELVMHTKPYKNATREKCLGMKNKLFGDSRYLADPEFLNEWTNEDYYESDQFVCKNPNGETYILRGGLYIPDKGHQYQPLELE